MAIDFVTFFFFAIQPSLEGVQFDFVSFSFLYETANVMTLKLLWYINSHYLDKWVLEIFYV